MNKNRENLCIIPWIHFVLDGNEVLPCCRMYGKFEPEPVNESVIKAINTDRFKEIRKEFIQNKPPTACSECFENESLGLISARVKFNRAYKDVHDQIQIEPRVTIEEDDIHYVDLRLSNNCNLSCRTCGPNFSSAWNRDAIALGKINRHILKKTNTNIIPELKNCQCFYFAGGEPLIDKEHLNFLTKLADREDSSKIVIQYNSNLDVIRVESFVDVWRKFKAVTISASIDHVEKSKAEYIRNKCNWERVVENLYFIKNLGGNIELNIQVTVSVYNVYDLPAIIDFFFLELELSPMQVYLNPLKTPEIYSVKVLPPKLKEELLHNMNSYYTSLLRHFKLDDEIILFVSNLKNIIQHTNETISNRVIGEFIYRTNQLDEIRKQDMKKVFTNFNFNILK